MTPEQEPNMKSVVLQGTVYIFNPPSEQPAAGDDALAATAGNNGAVGLESSG